jgi:D-alanyl-D-alanine carboxypeptidase
MMRYLFLCLCLVASSAWSNSYALYNYGTKEYIDKQDVESVRSIASITKLFTVEPTGVNVERIDVLADVAVAG